MAHVGSVKAPSMRRIRVVIAAVLLVTIVIISTRSSHGYEIFRSNFRGPKLQDDLAKEGDTSTLGETPLVKLVPLNRDPECEDFPNTTGIVVVMKTGAIEAHQRLPTQFLSTLRCHDDFILFSDIEMNVGDHHFMDALDEVADDIKEGNEDFDLYRLLQEYKALNQNPQALKSNNNGWNLDKYKFTHILLKSYREKPDAKWYVFMEGDTFLIWDNLKTYLDTLDSNGMYYIGASTYLDIEFAHGGSGYIISQGAMQEAVGSHPELAKTWDKAAKETCCGDSLVGHVMLDAGIRLTNVWPMINGDKPSTLSYGRHQWCQPLTTMHHIVPQEISVMYRFIQERKQRDIKEPLLIRDIFREFVEPFIQSSRDDWNNLSGDIHYHPVSEDQQDQLFDGTNWKELQRIEQRSYESPERCSEACDANVECFQWMHTGDSCRLNKDIKLGGSKQPERGKKWVSGWNIERVRRFVMEASECKTPDWVH